MIWVDPILPNIFGMLVINKDETKNVQINRIELSTRKILQETLGQSAFQQTLGDEFTFQQDDNLKHKAKSKQELFNQDNIECSGGAELQFGLTSTRKSTAKT